MITNESSPRPIFSPIDPPMGPNRTTAQPGSEHARIRLVGFREMSVHLDVVRFADEGATVWLQPSYRYNTLGASKRQDPLGPQGSWTRGEVEAAADWFTSLVDGDPDTRPDHEWFGGGVCFGYVEDVEDGCAIDVFVHSDPTLVHATFQDGSLLDPGPDESWQYVTVDATWSTIREVAAAWHDLARRWQA
jgi:hypothetical protein